MKKRKHTALTALREAYAVKWSTDDLAQDYATEVLISQGEDEQKARETVQKVFDEHFRLSGPV